MDLWIKGKYELIKADMVQVVKRTDVFEKPYCILVNGNIKVGHYSSEDKALKVLRQISNILQTDVRSMPHHTNDICINSGMMPITPQVKNTIVVSLPSDKDVVW